MNTNIIKNENCTFDVTATVENEAWENAQKKAFQKIKASLKLKGFRDGKSIPDSLAKPHIQLNDVLNEAINIALPETFEAVIKEHNVVPFMQPDVKVNKVNDKECEFEFSIPLYPEVELGAYKGLSIEKKEVSVTDEEVKQAVARIAAQQATLKTFEGAARMGDTVVFDFAGYVDGKPFDGGSATNYSLELGSNQFIPGFEAQLVGVKAGDEKEVDVTFPEQYVKELAGKNAAFKCVIHEIKEKLLPEINDDFAKELKMEGVDSIASLENNQKETILRNKNGQEEQKRFNELLKLIADGSKITISEKAIAKEVEAMREDLKKKIEQNGLSFEQYLEITNTNLDKLNEQLKGEAINNLKTFLALSKIAETEKLNVTDEDVDHEFDNMSKQYNMPVEKIKEILGQNIENMKQQLQQKKIEDFIKANNNI